MSRSLRALAGLLLAAAVPLQGQDAPSPGAPQAPEPHHAAGTAHPPGMAHAPGMTHAPGMEDGTAGPAGLASPAVPASGQAAFEAIREVVAALEADPDTDWGRVDLEALRTHLADMDAVTLRARVRQVPVAGGLEMEVTGGGEVGPAIRRMLGAHASVLDAMAGWRAAAVEIPDGVRLTVTAGDPGDPATIARIRGLGFAGLLVQGDHHGPHHLAIARGEGSHVHGHAPGSP